MASVPFTDASGGLTVYHPKFFNFPGIWKSTDASLMARSVQNCFKSVVTEFQPDLIDAHWAYPDGVAAAELANRAGLPYFITIRGDDISVFLRTSSRRSQILEALNGARGVIGVCRALVDAVVSEGIEERQCTVAPNGVDAAMFHPMDRTTARKTLNLDKDMTLLLSVGHICERKGFHLLVRALKRLKDKTGREAHLALIGGAGEEGNFVAQLQSEIKQSGMSDKVTMPGAAQPEELRMWYSAADLFCLASSREGWPNVLLEALACGCPVLATRVWGVPEIISEPTLGILVDRDIDAIAAGMDEGLTRAWRRDALSAYANSRSWTRAAQECLEIYRSRL